MTVLDAGCGVPDHVAGDIVAAGPGWLWMLTAAGPVQVTGPVGVRGPLSVRCAADPQGAVGEQMSLAITVERWKASPAPGPAPRAARRALVESLVPHPADHPAELANLSMEQAIVAHGGRGDGLTPEGDDLLLGLVAGRTAVAGQDAREEAALLDAWAVRAAGEPSRSLLRHAVRGELIEPAHDALAALVSADAERLEEAMPLLLGWGASSGRAVLAGLAAGVWGRLA